MSEVADFWSLTVPAVIGSLAWLYQKAWERHERRVKQYEEIMEQLPAFTVGGLEPDRIDKALSAHRKLWLIAPDNVVRAFEAFLKTVEGASKPDEQKELALGKFVIAIRRDATLASALLPRRKSKLEASEFKIKTATRKQIDS